jgi:hypothetical protein
MPAEDRMPGTVRRSSKKAQRTWAKTYDSATEQYGPGERASRTAYSALKHAFERKGDRWVAKEQKGPSDPRARKSGQAARRGEGETYGGVDFEGNTKDELYRRAKDLGIAGRSRMSKHELAKAIARESSRPLRPVPADYRSAARPGPSPGSSGPSLGSRTTSVGSTSSGSP